MSDQKSKKAPILKHQCETCHASILPLCCLISMLTAVLVTLIFSAAFTRMLVAEQRPNEYRGSFAQSISAETTENDNYGFVRLNSAAIIDMVYFSEGRGLVFVTDKNTEQTKDFADKIKAASPDATIYHYQIATDGDKADAFVRKLLVDGDSDGTPTLLYIRDGQVYDRLDDIRSESNIATFVAKYK